MSILMQVLHILTVYHHTSYKFPVEILRIFNA